MKRSWCLVHNLVLACVLWATVPFLVGPDAAAAEKKKVAVLVADWFKGSHPDVIVGRVLKTYTLDEKGQPSQLQIASVYRDLPSERDVSAQYAQTYRFRICDSVAEALRLGTDKLAVDGVILSTEWANYPVSETGQIQYPHRRLFEEAVKVMKASDRVVPVFIDKHLADTWEDSKWIYDTARAMKIPLMAGSSLPLTWRKPATDVDSERPLKEIVGISYHTLDGYGFHGLEMVQTLAERRKGGETGIKAVQCLTDDAVWAAAGKLYDPALLDAAIARMPKRFPNGKTVRDAVTHPVLFVMDYADGLRVNLFTLSGVGEWAAAWRYQDRDEIESTWFALDNGPGSMHFAPQMHGVEQMVLSGQPGWPVERTLMTSGALNALLLSKKQEGRRLETPYLLFSYRTNWKWQPPSVKPSAEGGK